MDPHETIDIARNAIYYTAYLAAPILIAGLIVGVLVGLLQALTQIQDQTVLFVVKLIATVAVLCICLPFLLETLTEYGRGTIEDIPRTISGTNVPGP